MLMTSLIIGATGLSAVLVINSSAKQSYSSKQQFLIPNVSYIISANSPKQKLTKQDYSALRLQGFNELVAVAQTKQHLFTNKNPSENRSQVTKRKIDFTGVDTISLFSLRGFSNPVSLSEQSSATIKSNSNQPLLQLSFNESSAILHPQLRDQLLKQLPENKLELLTNEVGKKIPVLKAYENGALGNDIIMDIAELYRLYPNAELSMLFVVGELSKAKQDRLQKTLPNHLQLKNANSAEQDSELTSSFHLNLMAMALLMFVVCLFIVVNAVNLLLNSRVKWLKICRQLGIHRSQLFIIQLSEIVMLTFLASFIGVLLGIELAKLASPTVQATLENLYSLEVGFGKVSITGLFIQVAGICLVGSICATFIPLNKLNHQLAQSNDVPLTIIQQKFWKRILWFSFIVFTVIAYLLLNYAHALWLLLAATACVILSGCCLLLANYPSILAFLQRFIPSRMPLLQISSKQSLALSGKTKIACCAFFIAATSNIGMNLMVDSFRGATVAWLEQRLVADYYYFNDGGKPNVGDLAKDTGVDVYQRLENKISFQGKQVQQYSYPSNLSYQQSMTFYEKSNSENLWNDFSLGKGVLVNQQFAFGFNKKLNDVIELPHPSSDEILSYEILGIIYDFGNPLPQVFMPLKLFDATNSICCTYALQGTDREVDVLREKMNNAGIETEGKLLKTEALMTLSMQAFDDTFIITDGLNIVTLLVAALSLACAIIVLMNDVRPQNMLIRSMGVSAFKTQLLALFQYLLLCFVALIFATPFGILLSWILIYDINYQAFSWTYPLVINELKILQVYVVSLLVVAIVIIIPIIRAGRRPLIEDIRWVN